MEHDQSFIAFVDCVVKGDWKPIKVSPGMTVLAKKALNDEDCMLSILQIDTVRRYLHFKQNATIDIMGNVVLYNNSELKDEITVDEFEHTFPTK